jgi:hypothetical protein
MPQVLTRDGSVFNFSDDTSPDFMNNILTLHALGIAQRAGQSRLQPSDPFLVMGPPLAPPLNPGGGLQQNPSAYPRRLPRRGVGLRLRRSFGTMVSVHHPP